MEPPIKRTRRSLRIGPQLRKVTPMAPRSPAPRAQNSTRKATSVALAALSLALSLPATGAAASWTNSTGADASWTNGFGRRKRRGRTVAGLPRPPRGRTPAARKRRGRTAPLWRDARRGEVRFRSPLLAPAWSLGIMSAVRTSGGRYVASRCTSRTAATWAEERRHVAVCRPIPPSPYVPLRHGVRSRRGGTLHPRARRA